jgi:hypothetical protein
MRFELMTSSLPRRRSTPELRGPNSRMKDEGGRMNNVYRDRSYFILHPSYFRLAFLERATRLELATLSLEG